ncbi:CpcD phycobilisome linker domain protein [Oscillatoria nigro-viridis PCC 7112]|uniref:CpcD phycobilisome linker domain protein n=1 Tax=Phormidium nigroviride PCC 7112 TaxID=179408 RepID=K9VG34_9CYAN|nr:phycobilisome linker polypeptide [Oscillatoria nigro-viridis]AFZ06479.1 CpcD phycobilisome linker domain protein [Oscillatoria nigro-viridis PCC 7112]
MLGQIVAGKSGNTASAARCFRYEVVGLRQSDEINNVDYSIRSSASTSIDVPYNRMNQEMQRITRMGGKIVSIHPLSASAESSHERSDTANSLVAGAMKIALTKARRGD